MRHIEDNIKEKRNKQYNKWARKYPSYISLILPIILGILIGVDDYMESKVWGRAIIYIISIGIPVIILILEKKRKITKKKSIWVLKKSLLMTLEKASILQKMTISVMLEVYLILMMIYNKIQKNLAK